ncbi:hypothetical protein N7488_010679 [Penicillium malachiteum]|nr:hypothetical protein N7488_010679 [Penicillium malachiteum]
MRTFDEVVDQLAAEQPDGILVKAGASFNGALYFNDITWSRLDRAANYIAHWIETRLRIPAENETMAYMGIGDIRYPIWGYKILLISPRNSEDGQVSLLKSTNCKKFLHTPEFAAQMQAFSLRHSELDAVGILDLDEIIQHDHTLKPSYSPPRPQVEDVAMILHSSGSTGLPKPIFIRTGALAVCDTITSMPAPPGRKNMHDILYSPTLMLSMMPLFHIMGITAMARAIYHQGP